jgi:undecaprenyl-diphosphatase
VHDFILSFFLGIVEGLTEFLPVSSTAHLRIAEQLFHIPLNDPYWKMYTIVIQLGAILALPVFFWGRILKFVGTFPRGQAGDRTIVNHLLSLVMIAFVCTAGPAWVLTKLISKNLESLTVIGASLVIGGAIMWAVDVLFQTPNTLVMEGMSLPQAIWIGIAQIASAVFPGTSRSMSTIAAGQIAGMSRAAALEFSFFLSMPTMAAATLYDLLKTLHPKHDQTGLAPGTMDAHHWMILAIGLVISFIVALGVVAWFMHWVRRRGFTPFAVYRIILGILVLSLLRNASAAPPTVMVSSPPTAYSVAQ